MSNKKIETLLRKRAELVEKLGSQTWLVQGTWVERYSTCSRPNCACHQGKRHGPRYYLSIIRDGRQRQMYVRRQHESLVKEGIRQGQVVDDLLRQLTDINLELLKAGAYDDIQP